MAIRQNKQKYFSFYDWNVNNIYLGLIHQNHSTVIMLLRDRSSLTALTDKSATGLAAGGTLYRAQGTSLQHSLRPVLTVLWSTVPPYLPFHPHSVPVLSLLTHRSAAYSQFTGERLLLSTEFYKTIFNNSREYQYVKNFYAKNCIAFFTIGLLPQVCRKLALPLYAWKPSGFCLILLYFQK